MVQVLEAAHTLSLDIDDVAQAAGLPEGSGQST